VVGCEDGEHLDGWFLFGGRRSRQQKQGKSPKTGRQRTHLFQEFDDSYISLFADLLGREVHLISVHVDIMERGTLSELDGELSQRVARYIEHLELL